MQDDYANENATEENCITVERKLNEAKKKEKKNQLI